MPRGAFCGGTTPPNERRHAMRSLLAGTLLLALGTGLSLAQTADPGAPTPGTQAVPPEKPATVAPDAPKPDLKPDMTKPDPQPMKPIAPVAGQPATFADTLRPTFVAQTPDDMVTSKIVGLSITNAANETIGEVADVVLTFDGRVKSWVVGVGGFLGIGTKYVAVDPSAMRLERADGKTLKAMINTDKDQLRAAPEYIYLGKEKPKDDGQGGAAK